MKKISGHWPLDEKSSRKGLHYILFTHMQVRRVLCDVDENLLLNDGEDIGVLGCVYTRNSAHYTHKHSPVILACSRYNVNRQFGQLLFR